MPHIGWVIDGESYTIADALAIAEEDGHLSGYPPALYAALIETREDGGRWLSPSQANKCHRQAILKAEHDYYLNVEHQIAAYVGRSAHAGMEAKGSGQCELFLSMTLGVVVTDASGVERVVEVPLQGTTDRYDPVYRRIQDYKWVSEFKKFDPRLRRGADRTAADPDHVLQINLYHLLLEHHGYPVDEAQVFYGQTYKEAKRNTFDVPLWDLDDTYRLACQLAEPLARYRLDGTLPARIAETEEDESYWLCKRCPVFHHCRAEEN